MNGGFRFALSVLALALVAVTAACDNKPSGTGTGGTATSSASASATPSATASASASALTAPIDTQAAAVPAIVDAAVAAKTDAVDASATAAATPSASASAKTFACGGKTNPCPLEAWMKKNAQPAVASGDTAELAKALDAMVKFAPPGYSNWTSIATAGATAAKAGDLAGAKASCRNCHDAYKKKYLAEIRDRKI